MSLGLLAEAVLLLTSHLAGAARDDPKPLSPGEWGRFAQWLTEQGVAPDRLLEVDAAEILAQWDDPKITRDRIRYLLGRSVALGLAVEKWERAGLWVLTRGDEHYPARLKKQLGRDAPPVLIGSGNHELLNAGGLAVVGSRDATQDDLAFASNLGRRAAQQTTCVVSGGASGVDEAAMLGALAAQGCAVGVLADRLLRASTSVKYRPFLMSDRLVLVTPFNPEAGFDVGNAMARNRYIYCLADAAIVVATSRGTGGTWHGALENLRSGWVPLWVRHAEGRISGASELVERGGRWLPADDVQIAVLAEPAPVEDSDVRASGLECAPVDDFYALFLTHAERLTRAQPATARHLSEALRVVDPQLKAWLARAVAEGALIRLDKPVRYRWADGALQPGLFSS